MDGRFAAGQRSRTEFLLSVVHQVVERRSELEAAQPEWPWARILPSSPAAVRADWARLRDAAVLGNLAALAAAPTTSDYGVLSSLVSTLGGFQVAKVQHARSAPLELTDELPMGTLFTFSLTPAYYRPLFAAAGSPASDDDLEVMCAEVSMRFMLQGMDEGVPAPPIETVEEFLDCFANESLAGWRRHLLHYALEPWSPYTRQLTELAAEAGNEYYIDGLDRFLRALRDETNAQERQSVAAEMHRLVAGTEITQREFARRVGTSPSRLSSYLSGSATPSAAMFLRIRRAALDLSPSVAKPPAVAAD